MNKIPYLTFVLTLGMLPACSNNPDYPVGKSGPAESFSSDPYPKRDETPVFPATPVKADPEPVERPQTPESQLLTSTVRIISGNEGTGVVIGVKDGKAYILTAAHVIENKNEAQVITYSLAGKDEPLTVKQNFDHIRVVATDKDRDLAVLVLLVGDGKKIHVDPVYLASKAPTGEFEARSIGCTNQESPSVRAEKVSKSVVLEKPGGIRVVVWECRDLSLNGRSGGPLVDSKGHLIGICTGTQNEKGYYIHLKEILSTLQKAELGWISTSRE